jgi:N-acetylglucosaminyldiphosphoundecaprenol N-acetyl-beta-D-mannosaminyltransferase
VDVDQNHGVSRLRVLGVRVDCIDLVGALERIEAMIAAGGRHQVATVNPEFVMHARSDLDFAAVLESADLCLADGWGVVWAARRQGCRLPGPVAGSDLVPALAPLCARRGWSLFLLGARPGVAEETARRLRARAPGLKIAGVHAGSPRREDDARSLELIAAARPDVLLVAYGHPQQELWIARNRDRLQVPLAMGVGGAFDYIAGRVRRAPVWMRRARLEWLFRLGRQPWRARRMTVLPIFAIQVLRS